MKNLDDAVIELNGVWPHEEAASCFGVPTLCVCIKETYSRKVGELVCCGDEYRKEFFTAICTEKEFTQRARELGFINGYRWGVEYPTNGKKPDLPYGLLVELMFQCDSKYECKTDAATFDVRPMHDPIETSFRITDQRYKPADAGYLDNPTVIGIDMARGSGESDEYVVHTKTTDSTIEHETGKAQDDSAWWDWQNDKPVSLPPVDAVVLVSFPVSKWIESVVVAHYKGMAVYVTNGSAYIDSLSNFKPLDHATRKAEADKKRVVGAVWEAYHELGDMSVRGTFEAMYDAGYLRMPPEKN